MGALTLFLGGAKSGKTRLALAEAAKHPPVRVYLATAQALDDEMARRISRHQAERGDDWRTVEAPLDPAGAMAALPGDRVVLLDCLTLWLNNLLMTTEDEGKIMDRVQELGRAVAGYAGPVVVVSNEVGGGLVPVNALARQFRDLSGAAHQLLAAQAEAVYFVVAGLAMTLKGR